MDEVIFRSTEMDGEVSINWDHLPDIALGNVFKHLTEEQDRFNASLVSKKWSRAFSFPEIWRRIKITPSNNWPTKKTSKFVSRFGVHLQELEIKDVIAINTSMDTSKSLSNSYEVLFQLTKKQPAAAAISLRKFVFNQACLNWIFPITLRIKIEKLIGTFLATQTNLTHLDMQCCRASREAGLDFLGRLAKNNSRKTLENLNLMDFFVTECDVLSHSSSIINYAVIMGTFENLVQLKINYGYIDSNVLKVIVENCRSSLEVLNIYFREDDHNDHVITGTTWDWVRKICPRLNVDVDVCLSKSVFSDYSHVISSEEMGLRRVGVYVRGNNDVGLNLLLAKLCCQFRESLVEVNVRFGRNAWYRRNFDDRLLIELASLCRELKKLHLHGVCSIETIKTLLEMLQNSAAGEENKKNQEEFKASTCCCNFTIICARKLGDKIAAIEEIRDELRTSGGVKSFNLDYEYLPFIDDDEEISEEE